jgi:AcrR family transcriptional regulator
MPRAGLDQQLVLQAAADLADEAGLDGVTLATLAQRLGIRTPSLYNHVNGLPDLRNKLAIYGMTRLSVELTREAVGKSQDDAVRSIARSYVAFVRNHPGLYEAIHRSPNWGDPEVKRTAGEVVDPIIRVFQAYGLDDNAAIHIVRGFRSLLHGFSSIEQQGGFGIPLDVDVSLQTVVDLFLAGIRSIQR